MLAYNSKPSYFRPDGKPVSSDDSGIFRFDVNQGNSQDLDTFSIGHGDGSQVLAITGFADSSVDIELQAAVPSDFASIKISFDNVANLDAFANAGASGTATSAAASQGQLTLTNGTLSGTYTASLSIDMTAIVAADHATIHMHITDNFQLSLSGTGYVGASLLATTAAGSTVVAMTPSGAGTGSEDDDKGGQFDLARFVASVLNTGQWNITFLASAPGESLHGVGVSVLTIAATAELAGGQKPELLNFQDTDRSTLTFNDTTTPAMGIPYGLQVSVPNSVNLSHDT
jgi:hypothetical protein